MIKLAQWQFISDLKSKHHFFFTRWKRICADKVRNGLYCSRWSYLFSFCINIISVVIFLHAQRDNWTVRGAAAWQIAVITLIRYMLIKRLNYLSWSLGVFRINYISSFSYQLHIFICMFWYLYRSEYNYKFVLNTLPHCIYILQILYSHNIFQNTHLNCVRDSDGINNFPRRTI